MEKEQLRSMQAEPIRGIVSGDPCFEEPYTLSVRLSGNEFYLAPPKEFLRNADEPSKRWCAENNFANQDDVFGCDLKTYLQGIGIPDIEQRIEESRQKIFMQFWNRENGCYFNNKKYGVEDINPFARTSDVWELPKLEMKMFITDYFTHRVMKDVCKRLVSEGNKEIQEINCARIGQNRIFFTSLGVNLVLSEDAAQDERSILVTGRSVNSSESGMKRRWSLSVVEGVSTADYDAHEDIVSLNSAVWRGLEEALNVTREHCQENSVKFHSLFLNRSNLEMGVACSVELKPEYRIEKDIIPLHGKDEDMEVDAKKAVKVSEIPAFLGENQGSMLPQALYTFRLFLEHDGISTAVHRHQFPIEKQHFSCSKRGIDEPSGDYMVDTDNFIAVIDGATPKGNRLWDRLKGDVFVARILGEAILELPADVDAPSAIEMLNNAVKKQYDNAGIDFETLPPEERLQASLVIYSAAKKEIWSFGDCMIRINQHNYRSMKKGDRLLSDLRAFCVEAADLQGMNVGIDLNRDYGREQILPFMMRYLWFANSDKSFGYDVINGGSVRPERVKIYKVHEGDHVVLASDGYPKLFDTLEETEEYLRKCLEEDPECVYKLRGTKGVKAGNVSYDDRCFIGFTVI